MKVGDLLRRYPEWNEIFRMAADLIDAGSRAKDGHSYYIGARLAQLVGRLAKREIEEKVEVEDKGKEVEA